MKIAIYAEHCIAGGRRAWANEEDENWGSDDIIVYEGGEEKLLEEAKQLEAAADKEERRRAGADASFNRRVARAIREATGDYMEATE
jgi:hypothetical protein